ncbi:MAG: PilZ domain-containing protein [Bdellovibrionota bacterium]
MELKEQTEKRNFARIAIDASVFVSYKGRLISGRVGKMSTRAIDISTDVAIPAGVSVEVVIVTKSAKAMMYGTVIRCARGTLVISESQRSSERLRNLFFAMA